MRWHTALLGLVVGTTTASCAFLLDFDELQKGEEAQNVGLADLPKGFAQAMCQRFDRCLGPLGPLVFGDEDCLELLTLELGDSTFAELAQLPPTGFVYHGDKVQACFDAVSAAACDTFFTFPNECEAALEGKVDLDGACTHPAECKRGLYCQVTGTCPGKCAPRPPAGQPCAQGACLEGLTCDPQLGCVVPVATGGECGGTTHPNCEIGLHCLGATKDKTGHCEPIDKVFFGIQGNVCSLKSGPLCGAGLSCQIKSDAEVQNGTLEGTCVPDIAPGQPCKVGLPDPCTPNFYCRQTAPTTVEGVCTELPGKGAECADDAVTAPPCKTKFRCLKKATDGGTTETCEALVSLGVGCGENGGCYSGNCANSTCAPPNFCKLQD
ncbi:MAG: hypothetical protein IT375_32665 [Polyangiaceae bacterium]|nr:hypothetical protein [Polyangiaceae bacterium]